MNARRLAFVTILVLGTSVAAWSQTYTETTTRVETKPVIITGEVVRLEPGKTIVVRSGGEEVTYVLAPGIALPAEVQVGRSATLQLEPGIDGTSIVKRVTTTTVSPGGQVKETTEVTRTQPSGQTTTTTTTATSSVTGEVVRLEPGKTIVIRSDGKETRYVLAPNVSLPAEVQVGRSAILQLEPGIDGTSVVKRVKTTTVGSDGQVRETTEITRTDPTGQTSRSTMTTLTGKVEAYMPGKSITVIDSKGARVTYVLSAETQVPSEVVMGKEVTVFVGPKEQPSVTYEIEKDGNTIKIKAKTKQ